jgi:molybdopterin molybdotransferase
MRGAPVIERGALLGTQHVLPLASLGIGKVEVYSKPKIAFIPTGREITDNRDEKLDEGRIYNSNLPYALALLAEAGAEVLPQATIPDDPVRFQATVKKLMDGGGNLIISSGAVSAGSHDFIRASLEKMGAEILFHKVAIKPGKPVLFAKLPNGTLYFGLPGNPISTAAGLRFFVQPLLAAALHRPPEKPFFARAKTRLSRKAGLRLFLKARIAASPDGGLDVDFPDGQESYKTAPFLAMNGWAVIPEDKQVIDINDIIEVYPLGMFS